MPLNWSPLITGSDVFPPGEHIRGSSWNYPPAIRQDRRDLIPQLRSKPRVVVQLISDRS